MPRPAVRVRPASPAERGTTAAIMAAAFIDDPAMAWLFRDAGDRAERLRRFFGMITRVDPDPSQWTLASDAGPPVAAAMWRPPGAWQTPVSAMLRLLPAMLHTFGLALPRALILQSRLEEHHPAAPHWYLQFAGCVPQAQGKGLGGAAIRARLADCDAQGLPAALETATPGNIGLYQSLGFVIRDVYAINDSLTFWTMWRDPR